MSRHRVASPGLSVRRGESSRRCNSARCGAARRRCRLPASGRQPNDSVPGTAASSCGGRVEAGVNRRQGVERLCRRRPAGPGSRAAAARARLPAEVRCALLPVDRRRSAPRRRAAEQVIGADATRIPCWIVGDLSRRLDLRREPAGGERGISHIGRERRARPFPEQKRAAGCGVRRFPCTPRRPGRSAPAGVNVGGSSQHRGSKSPPPCRWGYRRSARRDRTSSRCAALAPVTTGLHWTR